jgi:MOSC domain-containing protein YiiM
MEGWKNLEEWPFHHPSTLHSSTFHPSGFTTLPAGTMLETVVCIDIRIRHLFVSSGHNYVGHHEKPPGEHTMVEVEQVQCVAGKGILGDRYFGFKDGYKGQITFFEEETYQELCSQLGVWDRGPEAFRRNVITRGIRLNELIGLEFELQGVRFFGHEECKPCYWMDSAFARGAEKALKGRGGLRAKILGDGFLKRSR